MSRIGFDLMGSEIGPEKAYLAAVKFNNDNPNDEIYLYTVKEIFDPSELKENMFSIYCEDKLNTENSLMEVARKRNTTLYRMLTDLSEGKLDSAASAASSAALVLLSFRIVKPLEGYKPAFAPIFRGIDGNIKTIIDVGANIEFESDDLVKWAELASNFIENTFDVKTKVGLVNIGTEPTKGDKVRVETYKALESSKMNFIGNVEASDVLITEANVLTIDGFTGNILLKGVEGTLKVFKGILKKTYKTSFKTKLGFLLINKDLKENISNLNYDDVGGAPILGLNKIVIKIHGGADVDATAFALGLTGKAAKHNGN